MVEQVRSYNGTEFRNKSFKGVCRQVSFTAPRTPSHNPLTEQINLDQSEDTACLSQ
jgi:hypothetical protein